MPKWQSGCAGIPAHAKVTFLRHDETSAVTIDLTSNSIRQGARERLRAIEPGDWETYFAWNQDDERARNLAFIPMPQAQEAVRRWAEQEALRQPEHDNFRFVIEAACAAPSTPTAGTTMNCCTV